MVQGSWIWLIFLRVSALLFQSLPRELQPRVTSVVWRGSDEYQRGRQWRHRLRWYICNFRLSFHWAASSRNKTFRSHKLGKRPFLKSGLSCTFLFLGPVLIYHWGEGSGGGVEGSVIAVGITQFQGKRRGGGGNKSSLTEYKVKII